MQSTIQCEIAKNPIEVIKEIDKLNKNLKILAKMQKVNFLDLEELSSSGGLNKKFTYDGKHLSAEAYKVWVKIISLKLKEIGFFSKS